MLVQLYFPSTLLTPPRLWSPYIANRSMPATQQLEAVFLTGSNGSETCKTDLSNVLLIKRSVRVTLRCLCSLFTSFDLGLLDSLLKVLFPVGLPLKDLQCMVHSATWLKYWFVPNHIEHADACTCYMVCSGRVGPLAGNQPWHPIFKQIQKQIGHTRATYVFCSLMQPDKSDIADQMHDCSSQQTTPQCWVTQNTQERGMLIAASCQDCWHVST